VFSEENINVFIGGANVSARDCKFFPEDAVKKEGDGWDRCDVEGVCESWVPVNVDFDDEDFIFKKFFKIYKKRGEHKTWGAPWSKKI